MKPAWINTGQRLIRVDQIAYVRRDPDFPEVLSIVTSYDGADGPVSVCFENEGVRDREYAKIVERLDSEGDRSVHHLSGVTEVGPTLYRVNGATYSMPPATGGDA